LRALIIIPTLNEANNILKLTKKIISLLNYNILVIDDNSTDGTLQILKRLKKKYKRFNYVIRKKSKGIGSAHITGISYAFKKKFKYCISLDADGTHNPTEIKKMIKLMKTGNYDVVNTSRFLKSNSLPDWPYFRVIITKFRYYLVKFFLKTNLDSSSGFRCYNLKKINLNFFKETKNKDYFFLIEILHILEREGFKIIDIPIKLRYRIAGQSKMKLIHIIESLISLIALSIKI